ncbi:NUDIX hydrolase [Verrucomicrobiaceae bacterium N1E253]|uniref:NUDIX hydrolase n=1 Tax=Oceaniferula marina TaxID=2748318 RepID=A0A851GGI7_9BACT|nr:NUDIX hydrolase [Oceaniferula marina]NWK56476.1 NUDIX hydrolase [Oceaniferula marina]
MNTLEIARELQALAQSGLHFTEDVYDRERYERLQTIACEMLADQSNQAVADIFEWQKNDFGYATPKVDVRALIIHNHQVLLVRENADMGRWTLPGGWADVNDTPSEAITREVEEESGYQVRTKRLLAVLDREKHGHQPPYPYHIYKLFFECQLIGGEAKPTMESSESGYFDPNDLPELSISRVLPEQIQRLYQMSLLDTLQTWFD